MRHLIKLITALSVSVSCASTPPQPARNPASVDPVVLQNVHNALFSTFFPLDGNQLGSDISCASNCNTVLQMAMANRTGLFTALMAAPTTQQLLGAFVQIAAFTQPTFLSALGTQLGNPPEDAATLNAEAANILKILMEGQPPTATMSFADLTATQRAELINLFVNSNVGVLRHLGQLVRGAYLNGAYAGQIPFVLSGAPTLPREVDHQSPSRPQLPPLKSDLSLSGGQIAGNIDAIVVGAGPGGSLIAEQLQAKGYSVVLVDAGDMIVPGTYDGRIYGNLRDMNGARFSVDGGLVFVNGETMGGGATVNGDSAELVTDPVVWEHFREWRDNGTIPPGVWSAHALRKANDWVLRRMGTRQFKHSDLDPSGKMLVAGAKARGELSHLRYYWTDTYPDIPAGRVTSKISPVEKFVIPAATRAHHPLTIIPDARVTRVLLSQDQSQALGVEIQIQKPWGAPDTVFDPYHWGLQAGQTLTLNAPMVIVSAGSMGSPQVLQNSGLKNPNIGSGFLVHPVSFVTGIFDHHIDMPLLEKGQVVNLDYRGAKKIGNAEFLLLTPRIFPDTLVPALPGDRGQVFDLVTKYRDESTVLVGVMDHSNPNNKVIMTPAGAFATYAMDDQEKENVRTAIKTAAQNLLAAGAKQVVVQGTEAWGSPTQGLHRNEIHSMADIDTALSEFKIFPNYTALYGLHMMGSNKMGTSAENSVVDGKCQVWGTKGLYVVDSSVFPDSIGSHPVHSIYSIAKIFSDQFPKKHTADQ